MISWIGKWERGRKGGGEFDPNCGGSMMRMRLLNWVIRKYKYIWYIRKTRIIYIYIYSVRFNMAIARSPVSKSGPQLSWLKSLAPHQKPSQKSIATFLHTTAAAKRFNLHQAGHRTLVVVLVMVCFFSVNRVLPPENRPRKDTHLPSINFQVLLLLLVSLRN